MYTFGKDSLMLGMRFYKVLNEEEYKIFTLVKIIDNTWAQFMDEDDCSLVKIDKTDLKDNYVMLIDHTYFNIEFDFDSGEHLDITYRTYKYLRKSIFKETLNYILKLNNLFTPHSEILDKVWEVYFNRIHASKTVVLKVNEDDKNVIDLDNVANGDGKLPDSIFAEAEEEISVCIRSYEVFDFTECVNIDNINMLYFLLYDCKIDRYYIVLYTIDPIREQARITNAMNENMDLVQFMNK